MRAIELLRVVLGADLDMSERFVLMGIVYSISWESWSGPVSIKQIAGTANISTATVKRCLASLIKKGIVERQRSQSRFGEVTGLIKLNIEKINSLAVAQSEPTLAQSEPPLAQPDTSKYQPEPPLAQKETSRYQVEPSRYQVEPPISVLPVSSVDHSVSSVPLPVQQSVFQASPPSETPRETREPEPERKWRTLPPKTNAWALSKQYYALLKGLGHEPDLQLQNALALERVYPEMDDVHSFLIAHSHLVD